MKKQLFFLFTLIGLLSTACSKHSNKPEPSKSRCKISAETGGLNNYSFTYNSDGKVQTISSGTLLTTLTYSGNMTIATTKNNSGVFYKKATITFNEDGMTTNEKVEEDKSGTQWENYAYVYNGTQLIKEIISYSPLGGTPMPSLTITYTWSGGNPLSETVPNGSGVITYTYEYYLDKTSQQGGYLRFYDLTGGIKTVLPKNLVKSVSGNANIENYSYNFDNDGKISDFTEVISNGNTYTYNLQYQCK